VVKTKTSFIRIGNKIIVETSPAIAKDRLEAGTYSLLYDPYKGTFAFEEINFKNDSILPLPSPEFEKVINQMSMFMSPEVKTKFKDFGYLYKRGILLHGNPGCHAKGTKILMFDGTVKNVEDVVVGDLLMGPDSSPREVLKLARGVEEMVEITPTKGDSFIVNKSHILHLTPSGKNNAFKAPLNIKVSDYIKASYPSQERLKLTRTGVSFQTNKKLEIPPYILGVWIGDGTTGKAEFTTMDPEIETELRTYSYLIGMDLKDNGLTCNSGAAKLFRLNNRKGINKHRNEFESKLEDLGILNEKNIPSHYMTSSEEDRLEFLAGILDTDGSLDSSGCFDFIQKNEKIFDSVLFIARSLGFAAYKTKCSKSCIYKGELITGDYFRMSINGDLSRIPTRVLRKKAKKRKQIKDVLRTGFSYKILPEDEYFGFSLDKDHLYLTEDFTIHHNTGKTIITTRITEKAVQDYNAICLFVENINALKKAYEFLNESQPEQLLVVVFEEFDRLAEDSEEDLLLLLDGQIQRDSVIFLATTNHLDKIPPRLYRPGRMSSVIEVNYPTEVVRRAYFENKLGKNFKHLSEWVEKTEGLSVDELKEIVQAVYILNENLEETIERLVNTRSEKDYEKNEEEESNTFPWLTNGKKGKR